MANIEERIVFAVSPSGQGDGVPVVILGIPGGAWKYISEGKTNTFDLTKAGVPANLSERSGASPHQSTTPLRRFALSPDPASR